MRLPIRAAAIVVKDNNLLVMHRVNNGQEYWVIPGGGVEEGETWEEAVVRELWEETSLKIKVNRLLYHRQYQDKSGAINNEYYYLSEYVSGTPKLNASVELEEMQRGEQFYEPHWISITDLESKLLYPESLKPVLLSDLKQGFSTSVRELLDS